jgi:hypothetical protein
MTRQNWVLMVSLFVILTTGLFAQTIDKRQYIEIYPYDFAIIYRQAIQSSSYSYNGNYKATVMFNFNDGPDYYFKNLEEDTDLVLYALKRPPKMTRGQKVVVYFTFRLNMSSANDKFLDDVEFK